MEINHCLLDDADQILKLYDFARELQQQRGMVVWPFFKKEFIDAEIQEKRQFKLVIDNQIACNWAITYEDKEIWEEKDNNNSVYIHRIVTHGDYRGNRFIDNIVQWAIQHAQEKGKISVRLDTLGNNTKLIKHYTSAGFTFLGIHKLTNTAPLPLHYQNEPNCCLFEISL